MRVIICQCVGGKEHKAPYHGKEISSFHPLFKEQRFLNHHGWDCHVLCIVGLSDLVKKKAQHNNISKPNN